jgi:phosphoribosylanthranilate isomerase
MDKIGRMFVKVCGLRRERDVEAAVESSLDAIGFMLSESVRRIGPDTARRLAAAVPEHILTVGVFGGTPAREAGEIALYTGMRAIQLHGDYPREAFDELAHLPVRLIRATTLRAGVDVTPGAYGEDMLMLDSPVAGSGKRWDLALLDGARPTGRWILAGGLNADNVVAAMAAAKPWGVDVSSGVESARGVKDPDLIRQFVSLVRSV